MNKPKYWQYFIDKLHGIPIGYKFHRDDLFSDNIIPQGTLRSYLLMLTNTEHLAKLSPKLFVIKKSISKTLKL